jgi:hypothetical protein
MNPQTEPYEKVPLPQLPRLSFEGQAGGIQDTSSAIWASALATQDEIAAAIHKFSDSKPHSLSSLHNDACISLTSTASISSPKEISSNHGGAQGWFTRWFLEWWMMEIISWFFGLICMMIIGIVLSQYDGKPVSKWGIAFSMSSFISICSGFAKSALLLPTAEGKSGS